MLRKCLEILVVLHDDESCLKLFVRLLWEEDVEHLKKRLWLFAIKEKVLGIQSQ